MERLDKIIRESFFYRIILFIVTEAKQSFFFSASFNPAPNQYIPSNESSVTVKLLSKVGRLLDRLSNPISKRWKESVLIGFFSKLKLSLEESFIGRILLRFRFVYLLILYPVVDYVFRYVILGGRLGGIWDEGFFLFLVLMILVRRMALNIRWRFTDLDFPLIFFITVCIILFMLRSPDPIVAIDGFRVVVQYILWFFLVVQLIDSDKDVERMVYIALAMSLFIGLHAIYQFVARVPMLGNWVDSTETITTRAYSIMFSPNLLGSFFTLLIPIAFAVFVAEESVSKKLFALVTLGASGLGLIFTLSRGAWLAAFFGLIFFLLLTYRKILLPIFVFVSSIIMTIPALSTRFFSLFSSNYINKSSKGGRIFRFNVGLKNWEKDPIFGLGMGRFGGAVSMNYNLAPFYMDNYYMKTLVEMGVVGLSATLILYLSLIIICVLKIRGISDNKTQIILYGLLSGMFGVLIHNFMENIFESQSMVSLFWVVAALIMSTSRKIDKKS